MISSHFVYGAFFGLGLTLFVFGMRHALERSRRIERVVASARRALEKSKRPP
jgi:hypothetical protein